jgi:hypothetical protein
MDQISILPEAIVTGPGPVSARFLELGVTSFQKACMFVHELPYGYNADREDLMVLFRLKFQPSLQRDLHIFKEIRSNQAAGF